MSQPARTLDALKAEAKNIPDWRSDVLKLEVLTSYLGVRAFAPDTQFPEFVAQYAQKRTELDFKTIMDNACPRSKAQADLLSLQQWTIRQVISLVALYVDVCQICGATGRPDPSLGAFLAEVGPKYRAGELATPTLEEDVEPEDDVASSTTPVPRQRRTRSVAAPEVRVFAPGQRVVYDDHGREIAAVVQLVTEDPPEALIQAVDGEVFRHVPTALLSMQDTLHSWVVERPPVSHNQLILLDDALAAEWDAALSHQPQPATAGLETAMRRIELSNGQRLRIGIGMSEVGPRVLAALEPDPQPGPRDVEIPPRKGYLGEYFFAHGGGTIHLMIQSSQWQTTPALF